ncbi:MAG: hypothetical protein DRJ67_10555 [Thermoprotei archaeon]|nr:MAG: hypothetical protein DRJ67_10555 [Thermoprotei archaeon]
MSGVFTKEWALKWIRGSILSYVTGGITLRMVVGRIRRALKSYGVKKGEVIAIIDVIQDSPVYLPSLSRDEKASKLEPLRRALEEM